MIDMGKDLQQAFEDGYKKGFADGQSQQGIDKDRLVRDLNQYTIKAYDCCCTKDDIEDYQGSHNIKVSYILQGFYEVLEILEEQPTLDVPDTNVGKMPQSYKDRLIEYLKGGLEFEEIQFGEKAIEVINTYRRILAFVDSQPTSDGWIPVSERLPSRSNEYWATIKIRGNYYVRKVDFDSFTKKWHGWVRDGDEVIAWQEEVIPQPYKESE